MLTLNDLPPGMAPDGTPTVAPGQTSVSTGPTAQPPGPQAMPCPYEIAPGGAIQRRRIGSTAPAPDPCPTVTQLDNRGKPAPASHAPSTQRPLWSAADPAKVGEHRAGVLVPICQQAGIPAAYMDACTTFLQGRGATIDQFAQLLAQDPAAVAALQQQAIMAAQSAGGGGKIWPWLVGGLAVAGAATGIALYVRHRRRGRAGLGAASESGELLEMRRMLSRKGYDPRGAKRLHDEGMGPEELAERLRVPRGEPGSLRHTHGLREAA